MNELKNYISHQEEQGEIHISEEVLAAIAAAAAQEVEGVSGLATHFSADIAERLGKKNMSKGVRVAMEGKNACVNLAILMTYGCKITEVGQAVQEAVGIAIESMAGLTVATVNVNVAGMVFPPKT
ncbi:MAG: Asp23/Gls24 family envelope stress response protein [Eubacteriales bacterium]